MSFSGTKCHTSSSADTFRPKLYMTIYSILFFSRHIFSDLCSQAQNTFSVPGKGCDDLLSMGQFTFPFIMEPSAKANKLQFTDFIHRRSMEIKPQFSSLPQQMGLVFLSCK